MPGPPNQPDHCLAKQMSTKLTWTLLKAQFFFFVIEYFDEN